MTFKDWLQNPVFLKDDSNGLKTWGTLQYALAQNRPLPRLFKRQTVVLSQKAKRPLIKVKHVQQQLQLRQLNNPGVELVEPPSFSKLVARLKHAYQMFKHAKGNAISVVKPVALFKIPAPNLRLWQRFLSHLPSEIIRVKKTFKQNSKVPLPRVRRIAPSFTQPLLPVSCAVRDELMAYA